MCVIKGILLLTSAVLVSIHPANSLRRFPEHFTFGVSTAAYQVEGAWNVSDKGENIWDHLTHHRSTLVTDRSTGDVACDSYNNYKRDVEMLKELGVDFYRFSISWSRLLPSGFSNKISKDGLAYYNNLIDELIINNIQPVVTLYHWDLPQRLQDLGGWTNPAMADYFEDYARVAFESFGDRVKQWLTFNEPKDICLLGYGWDNKAPALNFKGVAEYMCAHTLLKSHAKAYHLYKDLFKSEQNGKVGLTLSAHWFEPADNSTESVEAAERLREFQVGLYAHPIFSKDGDYPAVVKERVGRRSQEQGYSSSRLPSFTPEEVEYIRGTSDFFGINHYTTLMCKAATPEDKFEDPSFEDDHQVSTYQDSTWRTASSSWLKVVPWGFRKLLAWVKETYGNPEVIIFENGYSDWDGFNDTARVDYYREYLNAMLDAIANGANVTGYSAWSLMDNFEWLSGYTERFGLYHVDYNDPRKTRTPKNSAKFYTEVILNRAIDF